MPGRLHLTESVRQPRRSGIGPARIRGIRNIGHPAHHGGESAAINMNNSYQIK